MSSSAIPLSGVEAPITPPLQAIQQAASIGALAQERQLRSQQIAENTVKAQQLQNTLNDDHVIRQAYADNNGDWDKTKQAVVGQVSPNTIATYDENFLKTKQAVANLDKDKLANYTAHATILGNAIDSLRQLPPDQRPAKYAALSQDLTAQGIAKPGELSSQYPGDDQLPFLSAHFNGLKNTLATEKDQRDLLQGNVEAAAKSVGGVVPDGAPSDPDQYQKWLAIQPGNVQALVSGLAPPDAKAKLVAASQSPEQRAQLTKTQADTEEAQGKAFEQKRNLAASDLASAKTQAAYTRKYDAIQDPKVQAVFPKPEEWTSDTSPSDILHAGENPTQRLTRESADRARDQADEREAARDRQLKIEQQRADQAGEAKPATPGQYAGAEAKKGNTIRDSTIKKDADISNAQKELNKNPNDKEAQDEFEGARTTAWQNHLERVRQAQGEYENQVSTLSGNAQPHNDWADKLTVPPTAAQQAAKVTTPPPTTPKAALAAKQQSSPAAKSPSVPQLKDGDPIPGTQYKVGQFVFSGGVKHRITGYNPKTKKLIADEVTQ